MVRKISSIGLVALGLGLSGCAHKHPVQGQEQRSEIPEGTRVKIGSQEVKEGEKVSVLKPECRRVSMGRGSSVEKCKDTKIGEALVLKVLDHDSAIVRPDEGVTMDTSMKVEKQ